MKLFPSYAAALLIVLFCYTAFTKFANLSSFESALLSSPFVPHLLALVHAVAVPLTELVISALLFFPRSQVAGLKCSLLLLVTFTVYLTASLLYAIDLPCNCGGVISGMKWKHHVLFNCFFIIINVLALLLHHKKNNMNRSPPQ